ncbi:proteasome subunit alpha type, putative [Ixodes scapularis]|uniref:Proteasome subunit alpha type, putative n=1 Tax=Ixodes scapularis TaxID=6945 RepID=B7PZ79_IXOSC|nr:proteasome subunit alpha type, putative [Ixodes scapularis]|eukprot:XP_002404944.1 proteasome subunit alpha type, putative [Ixodes scapularis]
MPRARESRVAHGCEGVLLGCRYSEELELEDAVHTAILTLKEGFEGQMTADNIEIGLCNEQGFRRLAPAEVKDYLANII